MTLARYSITVERSGYDKVRIVKMLKTHNVMIQLSYEEAKILARSLIEAVGDER